MLSLDALLPSHSSLSQVFLDKLMEVRNSKCPLWCPKKFGSAHVLATVSELLGIIGISDGLNRVIHSINKQTGPSLLALSRLIHLQHLDPEKVTWLPHRASLQQQKHTWKNKLCSRQTNLPTALHLFHCFTRFTCFCVRTSWKPLTSISRPGLRKIKEEMLAN